MALPDYTGRTLFSASIMEIWAQYLMQYYDLALAPRIAVFSGAKSGTWSGYILYTGETNTIYFARTDTNTITITINGVDYTSTSATGTMTVSGLTAGTVYAVTASGMSNLYWLGFYTAASYTAPPTLANGNTLTDTHLSNIRSGIVEIGDTINVLDGAQPEIGADGHKGSGDDAEEESVWYGGLLYTTPSLTLQVRKEQLTKGLRHYLYINGTEEHSTTYSADSSWDVTFTETVALTGSYTLGAIYPAELTHKPSGTTNTQDYTTTLNYLAANEITPSPTPTAPNVWAHGDNDVFYNYLNRYGDIINEIHPGATSPSYVMPLHQPAQKTAGDDIRFIHKLQYLYYVYDGAGTPRLSYAGGSVNLPTGSGTLVYDLSKISALTPGELLTVDDVYFAQEHWSD